MSYVLITDRGVPELHVGAPTFADLTHLIGGDVGFRQTAEPDVVFWFHDNFQAEEAAGRMRRNVVATVVATILRCPPDPLAGPVVFTGYDLDPLDGYLPSSLDAAVRGALIAAAIDVRYLVTGEGEPANPDWLTDPALAEALRGLAEDARRPYQPTEIREVSADDIGRLLGF